MDWTAIIVAVAGILAAVDLSMLIFPRLFRREKEVEIVGKEKDNKSVEVETLRKAIETLDQQLKTAHETIKEKDEIIKSKDERIEVLSDEVGNLKATCTALFDDMCVHKGCRVRKPHQGRGQQWYEQYSDDPALGADYLSIETLLKQERVKRLAATKAVEEEPHEADS